ncbi:unnamed protein product [Strongylus vulgaris]|uniref:Uncharacterized protein n=1 Tax=Strongylus vulgaris TaxID=40348 RepID=A0A3P7J1B9_STRVU|nr:unnamed protein product [Strongylus vulgaris]
MLRSINYLVAFASVSTCAPTMLPIRYLVQGSVDVERSPKETMNQWKLKVRYKLIEKIIATLKKVNVIACSYKFMYELYISETEALLLSGNNITPKVLMNLKHSRGGRALAAHHDNNIDAMSYPLYFPKVKMVVTQRALFVLRISSDDDGEDGLRPQSSF